MKTQTEPDELWLNHFTDNLCFRNDLSTYDPYDIWKTDYGIKIKDLFNKSRLAGALPALILTIADLFINNNRRWSYEKQEYPIVRSLAAQIMLKKYIKKQDLKYLTAARMHLEWLYQHRSKGYAGACWGLGFKWPASASILYEAGTPHATHTPYALEAFHIYTQNTNDDCFLDTIKSCFNFFEEDIYIMYEDEEMMATSYGPFRDRIATNAVSYAMMSYSIFLYYFPDKQEYINSKIQKLYRFIARKQLSNGSWLYTPDDSNSFIDCFHSCFIIKNLIKTTAIIDIPGSAEIIDKGYQYLLNNLYEKSGGLYKRFAMNNKISFIKYDLYDNSEMLGLLKLMNDNERFHSLKDAIEKKFIVRDKIYSVIDFISFRRNSNFLRWAVMPFLFNSLYD